jgi:hypothetical protein
MPEENENEEDPEGGTKTKGGKSEDEVRRIAAEEKRQGIAKGKKDLLKDLGFESEEEVKQLIKFAKDTQEATASEVDKATKKAEQAETKLATAEARAATAERNLAIFQTLVESGVPGKTMKDVQRLLDLEDDADEDGIKKAVEDLKERLPALFDVSEEGEDSTGGTSGSEGKGGKPESKVPNPGGKREKPGKAGDAMARGRATLYARHPELQKNKS